MPNIHLTLAGPPEAAYPNGGDEAYWMGQVAGALAAGLNSRGIGLCWGPPQEEGALWLALCSQAAPPEREGQLKGPALCFRAGDSAGGRVARALAKALEEAYPQPELIQAREEPSLPELEAAPCPGWRCACCTGTIPRTRPGWPAAPARRGRPWPGAWPKP